MIKNFRFFLKGLLGNSIKIPIMNLIKKNRSFTILSVVFLIWVVFLIVLSIFGQRQVIFYDVLGQSDVSSDFLSNFPLIRYIVEPFAAIAFILEDEFRWMFIFLLTYPLIRGIYLLLKKRGFFGSKKYKFIMYPIADIISFSFQVLTLAILIVGIYILIGFIIQGYFFVSRYFMIPIQLAIHIGFTLIILKIFYTLLKIFHPKLNLNLSKKVEKRKAKKSTCAM